MTSDHIGIALIELAVAALLRPVCPPHRLNLVTPEGKADFMLMSGHIAREGNREVITQCAFCDSFIISPGQYIFKSRAGGFVFGNMVEPIVEYLEDQFIPFFSILAEQGIQVFHGRRFEWFIPIEFEYRTDGIKNKIAFVYGFRSEITRSLR